VTADSDLNVTNFRSVSGMAGHDGGMAGHVASESLAMHWTFSTFCRITGVSSNPVGRTDAGDEDSNATDHRNTATEV
jgi:hypothetical protein